MADLCNTLYPKLRVNYNHDTPRSSFIDTINESSLLRKSYGVRENAIEMLLDPTLISPVTITYPSEQGSAQSPEARVTEL